MVVVAGLVAVEVWNWLRHGVPPRGIDSCIIFQTNHFPATQICKILKAKEIICKIFKTLELWFLWSLGRHKPEAGGFCLYLGLIIHGVSRSLRDAYWASRRCSRWSQSRFRGDDRGPTFWGPLSRWRPHP